MRKNGFTIIEVVVTFLLILGVTFFMLPINLETTKQAKLISKWSEKYSELQYMFSVIMAQKDGEIKERFLGADNTKDRNKVILNVIKPYLRITTEVNVPYKQYYMNKLDSEPLSLYDFENFYFTNSNEIVGLKLVNPDCQGKNVCALINFDLNGIETPNIWGKDIFGINVYKNSIEPIGYGIDQDILRYNCSNKGSGVYCSYYYLIGGKFD